MKQGSFIWLRVPGVLIVLGLIVGAGAFGYKAGIARGVIQAPEVAAAIEKSAESGQVAPVMPMYGYGYPRAYGFGHPHFFFPIGGFCFSIFFLFLFFGAMRMIFFRRMRYGWGHHGHHGPWGKWEDGVPPRFNEWHKRAHGEKSTEEEEKEDEE